MEILNEIFKQVFGFLSYVGLVFTTAFLVGYGIVIGYQYAMRGKTVDINFWHRTVTEKDTPTQP